MRRARSSDHLPGRVNVGNAFQFGAGLAFALNEQSSISMSYSQRLVERSRIRLDGQERRTIFGSQANDSPDMTINIRVPYRF